MRTDRTIVVTGAAGGMGALFVRRFLDNGDTVIATDMTEAGLATLRASAGGAAGALHTVAADYTEEAGLAAIDQVARDATGRVNVIVNSAGWFPVQPLAEMDAAARRKVLDINLVGPALLIRELLPMMTGRGWGRVVSLGSASIHGGVEGQVHYVSAKAGIVGMSRSLAHELGDEGITVNVEAPGLTLTPNARKALPQKLRDDQIQKRALKRAETPEDLAGTGFFLASPDADFVTGQSVVVNGGIEMI